jgi:hypothetical protein
MINRIACVLVGLLIFCCQRKSPKIGIAQAHLDLGKVNKGDTTKAVFKIFNSGNAPLEVKNANGNSDCISINWSKNELLMDDTCFVKIKYVPGEVGMDTVQLSV